MVATHASVPESSRPRSLDDAIRSARAMVIARQRPDGSWQERGDMGPFTTALALVSLHSVGHLPEPDLAEGLRWLKHQQRADGSFEGRPFANEGDLSTTAACWAALSLSTDPSDRVAADHAKSFVDAAGGLPAVLALASSGDIAPITCAMAGLIEPSVIPTLPLSALSVPRLAELASQRVAFFHFTVMVAVAVIAKRPAQRAQRGNLLTQLVARRECSRAIELLTLYQNRSGSLMNVVFHTALLIPALIAAGLPPTDPRVAHAIAWLRARGARDANGLFFDVYGSDVWSTASYLRVLLLSGSHRNDPVITRGIEWLLSEQIQRPHPVLTNPTPGAPRTGGWGFQAGEDCYPDCDTTSTVLDTLARALVPTGTEPPMPAPLAARVCASIAAARHWLMAMQNSDGGWASFFRGHPSKRPGPIMMRPMRGLELRQLSPSDPSTWLRALGELSEHIADFSTEDVTARVLTGLARSGTTRHAPEARRALEFLAEQQTPSGAWWGRWKVNYLPATAAVLSAYAALGEDLTTSVARRGLAWILEHQNPDGGFGETVESYRDPSRAGHGPSNAPLTGSVLIALIDAGLHQSHAAQRAADYLIAHQADDGAWDNGDSVATLVPPKLFYVYGGAARYIPLEALARYRSRRRPTESVLS